MSLRPRTLPVGFIEPCLPTKAPQPPSDAEWLHEIREKVRRTWQKKRSVVDQLRLASIA
jgi:hypothetical protein